LQPTVSIVIPVYNGSDYLGEAVDSALAQTYGNVEVLVVNDGSDDGGKTEGIARSYGGRIRYFRKENGGVGSALNLGIREMAGEYFSWLSHDDVYYPDKTEVQVRYLHREPGPVVLYGDYDLIDASSNRIGTNRISPVEPGRFRQALMTDYPINGCTALIPKRIFDSVGLFEEGLPTTQDYTMWFRMAKRFDFVHIPEILIRSRIHPGQGSLRLSDLDEKNRFYIGCLNELHEEWDSSLAGESQAVFHARVAVVMKKRGFLGAAEHASELSLRTGAAEQRWLEPRWVALRSHYYLYDLMRGYREAKRRFRERVSGKSAGAG
jgi:glycosyltransferase involved in cell wall biosynthesis